MRSDAPRRVEPEEPEGPVLRGEDRGEHAQQRRLARTVRAEQADDAAVGDEVDAVDRAVEPNRLVRPEASIAAHDALE